MEKKKFKNHSGYLLIQVLVYGSIGVIIIGGLVGWSNSNLKLTNKVIIQEKAFQIAEAGIDYYRWHLAHAPTDYQDGTGQPGPYIHNFYNKNGEVIGNFSLIITPPPIGSTLVVVKSTGSANDDLNVKRTIEAKFAIPSLAKYAFVANSKMRFGEGTEIFGPVHSNDGIRFDGIVHNLITSAKATYKDPDDPTGDPEEFGVHTHRPRDPFPLVTPPNNTNVFVAGRQFPVPVIDFNGFTADLANIKNDAQTAGRYFAGSGALGYHLVLKTNDTFDLYKVTSVNSPPYGCSSSQSGWGTWTIRQETFLANYSFPSNGLIFVSDHVWVDGKIDGSRLTIASGIFPESVNTNTNIIVNRDLTYTNYDGRDVLSLIAQNNFNVGLGSENDLQIDGAVIAKNGRVGRHYYNSNCGSNYKRYQLTLFGMIASNQRYGFAYTDGTGYEIRNINYDGNLLYGPPPSFPLTSDQYQILSWREI